MEIVKLWFDKEDLAKLKRIHKVVSPIGDFNEWLENFVLEQAEKAAEEAVQ
jgi:hypothetical protein